MTEKMSFGIDVDKALIEQNVTALVAHAIADALGDKEALVQTAVSKVLSSYVNEKGDPCKKDDWRSKPFLQYLAERCVVDTVREEIIKAVEENKEEFRTALKKEISKPKMRETMAASFINAILTDAANTWKMPVKVEFQKPQE